MQRSSRGFALLVVLWTVVVLTATSMAVALSARAAVAVVGNRAGLIQARWLAQGCADIARSRLDEWLEQDDIAEQWGGLDRVSLDGVGACEINLRPAGLALNVNRASVSELQRLLRASGLSLAAAESLANAIADWRDRDDYARPTGAERQWYAAANMPLPRNGAFQAAEEVLHVRGADAQRGLDSLLGVERDEVLLTRAPAAVLAALPGMTPAAIAAIEDARVERKFPALSELATRLTGDDRQELLRALPALQTLVTTTPRAWFVHAAARGIVAPVQSTLDLRVVLDGTQIVVVERSLWP